MVLDGNLSTYRISLQDELARYTKNGIINLIASKKLFKTDPSIACYQIKRKANGQTRLTGPSKAQVYHWRQSDESASQGSSEHDFYHWKKRHLLTDT